MRDCGWVKDPEYIVNLTRSLIGKETLETFRAGNETFRGLVNEGLDESRALFLTFEHVLTAQVKKMSVETLGKICNYGTPSGFHSCGPLSSISEGVFLNLTGFNHVMHYDFERSKSGPALLEAIAVATIVCVARDIILQDKWRADREHEVLQERLLEHAEHRAIHPNR